MCSKYRFPQPLAHLNSHFLTNVHEKHTNNRLFSINRLINYDDLPARKGIIGMFLIHICQETWVSMREGPMEVVVRTNLEQFKLNKNIEKWKIIADY